MDTVERFKAAWCLCIKNPVYMSNVPKEISTVDEMAPDLGDKDYLYDVYSDAVGDRNFSTASKIAKEILNEGLKRSQQGDKGRR